ncbi:hypothetical protein RhiJN_00029 [Ceratobasidium sp. AG-Ba]|nr:hypothetical protein RhiJN_00029 [Ceratobasidium sp. AG-Ba]QRW01070.1 hypothetical protein RhiLY_00067 [Ceratobasidium sp. AG-Ba]
MLGQSLHKKARGTKAAITTPHKPNKLNADRLCELPQDIIHEIATLLTPADLLSLARTNKPLRKMFMTRTAQHLWKAAISNIPHLPECPPQLSEPQYISMLYSNICSNCGAKVLRAMDPYLLVRLCNHCRDELVRKVPTMDPIYQIVPRSKVTKLRGAPAHVTLKSDFDKMYRDPRNLSTKSRWYKNRKAEVDQRQMYGRRLEKYLKEIEQKQEKEIDELKKKRWQEIKDRIAEHGWTEDDMKPSPTNQAEWHQLVEQPKPLTDRIWTNLYPKLLPLLQSNREHNEQVAKLKRRRLRIKKMEEMTKNMRAALPPLVHVTMNRPAKGDDTAPLPAVLTADYPEVKLDMPFPSTAEFVTWPMIQVIVDDDYLSPEDAEVRLAEARHEIDQAVIEWRDNIEQDLVNIWNAREGEVEVGSSPSKGKRRGKSTTRTATRSARTGKGRASASSSSHSHQDSLVLPEFTVTFAKPDGTTTTDISELSPNMQLLLRADTMFTADFLVKYTFPAIVPSAVPLGYIMGGAEDANDGERWNSSKYRRDHESSAVAKQLLALIGRPDATSAETEAFGGNFLCGKCTVGLTDRWDDLVHHYAREQAQWRRAQEKIQAEPDAGFVYNNTHDLGPGDAKPFARFLTPQESADYSIQGTMVDMPMMQCIRCDELGMEGRYFHVHHTGGPIPSPIVEHLRDVHEVVAPKFGKDYRRPDWDIVMRDPWEGEEYESDEDDYWWAGDEEF